MSGPAIRFRDDPWQRLPWLLPLALLLTVLSQMGFLSLLRQPSTPTAVQRPVDVQVMELPVTASAPATQPTPPARRSPAPLKPRTERPIPRPTPAPQETRVEAPRDPTPAPEAEPSAAAPSAAATVPAPAGTASPSAPTGLPPQTPVAAVPPDRGPQGPPSGTDTMSARAIYKPMPEIPDSLRHRTVDLVAVARFRVTVDGSAQVELTQPTGDPDLNRALVETLKRWRFFPAMQAGKPILSTIDIRIPISVK
jgi:periplasmic protein TonB